MKKYLFMCLMAAAACFAFTACGKDDPEPAGGDEDVNVTNAEIKETANQLVLTMTAKNQGVTVTYKWTCDFQNNLCTRSIMEMTYPSESMAEQAYESAVEDKEEGDKTAYSVKGKVVTADMTEVNRGQQKSVVKMAMEAFKSRFGK